MGNDLLVVGPGEYRSTIEPCGTRSGAQGGFLNERGEHGELQKWELVEKVQAKAANHGTGRHSANPRVRPIGASARHRQLRRPSPNIRDSEFGRRHTPAHEIGLVFTPVLPVVSSGLTVRSVIRAVGFPFHRPIATQFLLSIVGGRSGARRPTQSGSDLSLAMTQDSAGRQDASLLHSPTYSEAMAPFTIRRARRTIEIHRSWITKRYEGYKVERTS